MKIIVSKKNEKYGPFEISQVQYYVDVGFFQITDYCYIEGWQKWELLSSIVSRMPRFENDIRHSSANDPNPQVSLKTEGNEKKYEGASPGTYESRLSDQSLKHGIEQDQNSSRQIHSGSQGLDVQKFSNMASFGFFNFSSKPQMNMLIYLARNGEIIDRCPKHEIADKLSSGHLLPDDWFFDETTREWMPLRQSSW
jgi:hypothetical protein